MDVFVQSRTCATTTAIAEHPLDSGRQLIRSTMTQNSCFWGDSLSARGDDYILQFHEPTSRVWLRSRRRFVLVHRDQSNEYRRLHDQPAMTSDMLLLPSVSSFVYIETDESQVLNQSQKHPGTFLPSLAGPVKATREERNSKAKASGMSQDEKSFPFGLMQAPTRSLYTCPSCPLWLCGCASRGLRTLWPLRSEYWVSDEVLGQGKHVVSLVRLRIRNTAHPRVCPETGLI